MILTGLKIKQEVEKKNIIIEPFNDDQINPNSYDYRIGSTLKVYKSKILDTRKKNETESIEIPETGFVLKSDKVYLGHTIEVFGSDKYVPLLQGKSSTGRVGLFMHISVNVVDIGYIGQYTLMMHAVQPVKIYPGMRLGQVTFWKTLGEIKLYDGKYQNGVGPQSSQIYKDFLLSDKNKQK